MECAILISWADRNGMPSGRLKKVVNFLATSETANSM